MLPHADTDTSAMLTSCLTTALRAQNFEHLTQAATGATSGDWLVKFCKSSVSRCSRVESTWSKLSAQLAAAREVLEAANRATAHMYIVQPIKRWEKRSKGLFSTHPSIADRVHRIEQLVV